MGAPNRKPSLLTRAEHALVQPVVEQRRYGRPVGTSQVGEHLMCGLHGKVDSAALAFTATLSEVQKHFCQALGGRRPTRASLGMPKPMKLTLGTLQVGVETLLRGLEPGQDPAFGQRHNPYSVTPPAHRSGGGLP